jgi:hypothetical protein
MSSLEEAGHIRTAIIGTCANIAGAVAIGIFQDKFRAYMLSEIKRMPKPRVDTSGAKEFFSNPQSRKAINVINLLNKDVDPFARELAEHHQKVISVAAIELTLLRLSFIPDTEKLEFLKGLEAQLDAYDANLTIAEDNLEASQQVSIDAIETAKGGEAAAKIIGNIMVADELVQAGISVEEIVDTIEFFDHYSWRVRSAFDDLARLHAQVTRQRHELANIRSDLNLFFWQIVLSIAARDPQALRMVQHRNLDASAPTAKSSADPQNKPKSSADPQNKPKLVPVAPLR